MPSPLKIRNPKSLPCKGLAFNGSAALNQGLPVVLTEVTRRNPRAVQGKELVLTGWKREHLSCSGIPRDGEVHNPNPVRPSQSVKDHIPQSLNGPSADSKFPPPQKRAVPLDTVLL